MRVHCCGDQDGSTDAVQLPETIGKVVSSTDNLMSTDLLSLIASHGYQMLASLNKTTCTINATLVEQLPCACNEYKSFLDSELR